MYLLQFYRDCLSNDKSDATPVYLHFIAVLLDSGNIILVVVQLHFGPFSFFCSLSDKIMTFFFYIYIYLHSFPLDE